MEGSSSPPRPDRLIGLLVDPGPGVLEGMLGILESGCGFLPLDPQHPEDRLAFMLEDCAVDAVVTDAPNLERASRLVERLDSPVSIVLLTNGDAGTEDGTRKGDGNDDGNGAGNGDGNGDGVVDPAQLAYVIYTSGSTGTPKGVGISRANLAPMLRWGVETLGLDGDTRALQSLSYGFDFGVFEQLTTVLSGGTLYVLPKTERADPERFERAAREWDIDVVHTTPSFFRELARSGASVPALRTLHLGGEALDPELVATLAGAAGDGTRIWNGYGPTEATINSTIFDAGTRSEPTVEGDRRAIPIGRPSAENRVYVLDARGARTPPGMSGELCVGGPGVARGYLGRPAMTAARFVPDPYSGIPGGRLYRTGDRVRFLASGDVEFLGRFDDQIKLRGFRIELGEIEAALRTHPEVADAAVVVHDSPGGNGAGGGDPALVAWLTASGSTRPTSDALRAFLGASLPPYMVPAHFAFLEALPRSATGKTDRARLAKAGIPGHGSASVGDGEDRSDLAPSNRAPSPAEILAARFAEALGLDTGPVAVDDDFFARGGQLVGARRLIDSLADSSGVALTLEDLFASPTPEALAATVDARGGLVTAGDETSDGVKTAVLSFAQERLWFLEQLEPGKPTYHITSALKLLGRFSRPAFAAAFEAIVARHEALRTSFVLVGDQPRQRIVPPSPLALPLIDLRGLGDDRREAMVHDLVGAISRRPFDLARGPLLRTVLIQIEDEVHALAVVIHHIVADGWSISVFIRELVTHYQAASSGVPATLPPLPTQYPDFAAAQRARLAAGRLEEELDYWRRQLAGAPPQIALQTDFPRPALRSSRGDSIRARLDARLTERLEALARERRATLFMVLLAGFQTLLGRYAGEDDILVGTPIAGRTRAEIEPLIGFFVNTLVLRGDLSGTPTFAEMVDRARATTIAAYDHQEVPFERLVDALGVARDLASTPLYQVMFALQNTPKPDTTLDEVRFEGMKTGHTVAKCDLSLTATKDVDGGLRLGLEYATDLFAPSTVRGLLRHFENLLTAAAEAPQATIDDLPLMDDLERGETVDTWRLGADVMVAEDPIQAQVRRIAEVSPTLTAIVGMDGTTLSYGEWIAKAQTLTARLREHRIPRESIVGLLLDRSPELIVGALGVLDAGAAYLPLDPHNPPTRMRQMLEDARCRVVLASADLAPRLADLEDVEVWEIDHLEAMPESMWRPPFPAPAEQLAYVIFTSGSTGRPKGIAVPHRGLANLIDWYRSRFACAEGERTTITASTGFDASVMEIWGSLSAGLEVHVPDPETIANTAALSDWLIEREIDITFLPTPLGEALLEEPKSKDLPLRILNVGGDRLKRRPGAGHAFDLHNHYGPSEASVVSTCARVAAENDVARRNGPEADRPVTIGRVLPNVTVDVLDPAFHPVPAGVPGELYVGGAGLARGYLGRPALTAERFVPDPFSASPGRRLYRTGDLVRFRDDGELLFIGRVDHQVKLRGFRIELGEIEARLASMDAVEEAAVVLRERGEGDGWLVGFWRAVEGTEPDGDALRRALESDLPAYMVPSRLVLLDALPHLPNGKIDRRTLAEHPLPETAAAAGELLPPRTPTEITLTEIWQRLLGTDRIGRDDDFFALGGHSLLATRVATQIRAAFDVDIPLRTLFSAATVESLAAAIEHARGAGLESLPPIARADRDRPIPLSFAQERLWFIDRLTKGRNAYTIPLTAIYDRPVEARHLETALGHLVARHESLRTVFAEDDGTPRQIILEIDASRPRLPRIDLEALEPDDPSRVRARGLAAALVRGIASKPFDLDRGPLVRGVLISVADDQHVLHLSLHHIIVDGISVGVLRNELEHAYRASVAGTQPTFEPLPIQYADYAAWQRTWLGGAVMSNQARFWRDTLAEAPSLLALPTDGRRDPLGAPRAGRFQMRVPATVGRGLAALATRHGATRYMVLLAGYSALLSRLAGQRDVVIGTPVAGRRAAELDGLIGLFVNLLPIRIVHSDTRTVDELVDHTRDAVLAALDHQDLPFEQILNHIDVERSLDHEPLVQATFQSRETADTFDALDAVSDGGTDGLAFGEASVRFELEATAVIASDDEINIGWGYRADLFEAGTVATWAEAFGRLLEAMAEHPESDSASLPLLSDARRERLIAAGARAEIVGPAEIVETLREAERPWLVLDEQGELAVTGVVGRLAHGEDRTVTDARARWRHDGVIEIVTPRDPDAAPGAADPATDPLGADGAAPPRGETETTIAKAFAEVLGIEAESVTRGADFFALGGHSLLATRLVSRLRKVLEVDVELAEIFATPSPAGLARTLDERVASGGDRAMAIPRRSDREDVLPLSFAQERLWFLDRFDPGSAAFNMPVALRFKGALDIEAMTAALTGLIDRHASLRTTFETRDERPVQRIHDAIEPPLTRVDLSGLGGLDESARNATLESVFAVEASRPFDLARGPLVRFLIARIGDEEHAFQLTLHHIVADGWSMGILASDIGMLYRRAAGGGPEGARLESTRALEAPPITYADFAAWQREWMAGERFERQLAFWRRQLHGVPASLELPTDRPRTADQGYDGDRASLHLPETLVARLESIARAQGATLFMPLVSVFAALMGRLAGQTDLTVGTPIAGRGRPEIDRLIGIFLNHLVLRFDLDGRPSLETVIRRTRRLAVDAYAHQDVPFEALLDDLGIERDLTRTPLFQVYFNMLNLPATDVEMPDVAIERMKLADTPSKFELTVYAKRLDDGLVMNLVYNAHLFSAARIEALLAGLRRLLEAAAADPARPLDTIGLLEQPVAAPLPDPRARLDATWHGSIGDLVAAEARRRPAEPAVEDPSGTFTFESLISTADRIAHRLLRHGLEPGEAVAIYAHRSAALAPAVLGVLRAGGAFTMLDPAYPASRLCSIVSQSRIRAWIAMTAAGTPPEALVAACGELGADRIDLPPWHEQPDGGPGLRDMPTTDPGIEVGPDDRAVLGFTSGSTGEPKGIEGRHGPLSHFLPWQRERFGLTSDDRFSLLSGLAHDPLQRDLFTALATGARVVIPDADRLLEPGYLAGWVAENQVTVAHLTPAMGQVLTTVDGRGVADRDTATDSLRLVMLVGDVLTRRDVARLRRLAPAAEIVNLFGSTETQRAVGFHVCAGDVGDEAGGQASALEALPVGQGMPNVQLLVVNAAGDLAAVGELGEIFVRSPHLARGYLDDAARTDARFAPNPFAGDTHEDPDPDDRIYRTGDLGRYLPDGDVVFAGRADRQVQIRGFRIELGEIEAALVALDEVREATVLVLADAGERRLVACVALDVASEVAADAAAGVDAESLRAALVGRLPQYMVPSAFLVRDALPLTPNGKIDRRALEAEARALPVTSSTAYRAPETETERSVIAIMRGVLGLEMTDSPDVEIGLDDDFFSLGGHSLRATQLVSRLRETFGVEVPLRRIFETPTAAGIAVAIGEGRIDTEAPLVPRDDDGPAPLSFAQERMWFLEQLEPGNAAYHLPTVLRLVGDLSRPALSTAFETIVRRHDSLRTTFVTERDSSAGAGPGPMGPRQVVRPFDRFVVLLVDLRGLEPSIRFRVEARLASTLVARPFDLETGPLIRVCLLQTADDVHALVMVLHHIVSDGWSSGVMIRELTACYEASVSGEAVALPALPVQYPDFAVWQRHCLEGNHLEGNHLEGGRLELELDYWRRALAGAPQQLTLPTDRPRPAVRSNRGAVARHRLDADLVGRLEAAGASQGATLFMSLLAGLHALLGRYAGEDDVLIGSPIAGRTRAEVEPLIGFFVNTLVLRGDLSGDPGFHELLRRTRATTLGAYEHQQVPFERLVDALDVPRDLASTPLFQVLFVLQNTPRGGTEVGDLRFEPLRDDSGSSSEGVARTAAKFDLSVTAIQQPDGGLVLGLEYATDLFEAATAERLLRHLETLLGAAVEAPEAPVGSLPLVDAREASVLASWNETAVTYPGGEATLGDLLRTQAARTPDNVALVFEGATMTYGELMSRAGRLARRLVEHGVGPDVLVGICAERSFELMIGLLAILEAGGAYVPLDPSYPEDRLRFMAEDARMPVLLVQPHARGRIGEVPCAVLELDEDAGLDDAGLDEDGLEHETPTPSPVPADALAYMIYTSGSTGRPKGAMNSHRAIVNRLAWMQQAFRLGGEDVVLQKTPISFDVSVWELFWPLITGARLVLAAPEAHKDPDALSRLIEAEGVTFLHFVPSMLQAFIAEASVGRRSDSIRQIVCSGEALPYDLQERCFARLPHVRLANLYGPTEAAVDVTVWHCVPGDARRMVPIGAPIANTRVRVLDSEMGAQPIGVPGQLFLSGVQLARGYHRRPGLTALTFRPDPHASEPGARTYATGDLTRWRSDGNVEFLGRIDNQVKLRGFRIELGEIEASLLEIDGVREATVLALEDAGEHRLVACVAGDAQASADPRLVEPDRLRDALLGRLPEYMVPASFLVLDALPLNPSGKVDRRALEAEARALPVASSAVYRAPESETERRIVGIMESVLGVEIQIGLDDDFFALGGHSLRATQLVSRLRETFGVEVPLRRIFEAPTAAGIATAVHESDTVAQIPIVPLAADEPAPLSFAQERMWFLNQLDPDNASYHVPAALRLLGPLDPGALESAFTAVMARHAGLRTVFEDATDGPRQRVLPPPPVPLARIDLRDLDAASREAVVARSIQAIVRTPFDLTTGPLMRTVLMPISAREHVLVIVAHHIVTDGWSNNILTREVATLYRAFADGRPSPLPPLELQVPDVAAWQRTWLDGARLDAQLDYWRQALDGAPDKLSLPTDRPRPPVATHRGDRVTIALDASLAARVRAVGRARGATDFMVLLAAFHVLLHRLTGEDDILVGTPIAGRTRTELEPLIGLFVNTLVIRGTLGGDPRFVDVLDQTRRATLDAFAHQDLPFERLVDALEVPRELATASLFQVMFVLQNAPRGDIEAGDLRFEALDSGFDVSKFDLTLTARGFAADPHGAESTPRLTLTYGTDLFDRSTAEAILERYTMVLRAATESPETAVARLPVVMAAEQATIDGWNETAKPYPGTPSLVSMLASQVAETPDGIALVFDTDSGDDRELTYAAMWRRAGNLASDLVDRGVGPEVVVGICAERSLEMMIGMVAVLRAGGAYLPLDPSYPDDRLAIMIEDADAKAILVQPHLVERLAEAADSAPDIELIMLDADAGSDPGAGSDPDVGTDPGAGSDPGAGILPRARSVDPDNLAYVIFTSGSTGRPKGVMIQHRSVANFVHTLKDSFPLTAADRMVQKTPISFDASGRELWNTLTSGATLVIADPRGHKDTAYLADLIRRHRITVMQFVPALISATLDEPAIETLEHLRTVGCGGEAMSPELAARVARRLPNTELINTYGPTEATVSATEWPVPRDLEGSETIPIGRPLPNTETHVLDRHLRPVPIGVAGQLFIGGVQVARGYRGRPALTAERFVPHPLSRTPGARLYATGDLVRWRTDGTIEFFGRIDTQVKVRGFRVELGEIEHRLLGYRSHEGHALREVAVLLMNERLIAFVVGDETRAEILESYLAERLPEYMVPAAFVHMDRLPKAPSGKIDRKVLAAQPVDVFQASRSAYRGPETATQRVIAELWQELLDVPRVGQDDDFFDLGGHSLLATRVMARIRADFGVEVPLRTLFETPTLAAIAGAVDAAQDGGLPPIEPADREGPIPLSFAQERLWFVNRIAQGKDAYAISQTVVLRTAIVPAVLERALAHLILRHEVLRTVFETVDGTPRQRILPSAPFEVGAARDGSLLPHIDLSRLTADDARGRAAQAARAMASEPFDLARGPLLRAMLISVADDEHLLHLRLHHIIVDGLSRPVIRRDLLAAYRAFATGGVPDLAPLRIQYADYAAWQRGWLDNGVLSDQERYWRETLEGAPSLLDLPTDGPRDPRAKVEAGRHVVNLPPALGEGIGGLAQEHGATRFMVLFAAFSALMARLSGQDDVVIGTPVGGRRAAELEPLIGLFVNVLPLRIEHDTAHSGDQLVRMTRDTVLAALDRQDLPFERILQTVDLERNIEHEPLVQVVFQSQEAAPVTTDPRPVAGDRLADDAEAWRPHPVAEASVRVELEVVAAFLADGSLTMTWSFRADLFDPTTIAAWTAAYAELLERLVEAPDRAVRAMPLVAGDLRRQVLDAWGRGPVLRQPFVAVQAQTRRIAETMPDAVAVTSTEGATLTYGELVGRALGVAARLGEAGIGPEDVVALLLDRSPEMAYSALGALETGAAYVSMDPKNPATRLEQMLGDAGCRIALTSTSMVSDLPRLEDVAIWTVDDIEPLPPGDWPPPFEPDGEQIAYVNFTSGSTGRPKGVAIPHRGLSNLVAWYRASIEPEAGEAVALTAAPGFDGVAWELWTNLTAGTHLVAPPSEIFAAPDALAAWLATHRIGVTFLPTPVCEVFLDDDASRRPDLSLRVVFAAGDRLRRGPDSGHRFTLINSYGPSEATVQSTWEVVAPDPDRAPSIGRPASNIEVYLLDEQLQPVPPGVPGEIHIGGAGLARGYLGKPALTAERFVPSPFPHAPGARIYRSGDRARFEADGRLAFIDRVDDQVKIRGFRIELGEIETALGRHPSVRQAAVVARDGAGGRRLVAFVVEDGASDDVKALGPALGPALDSALRDSLPEYMVPAAFETLERLPLTRNGKIDRRRLASMPLTGRPAVTGDDAPRNLPTSPLERSIAAIWCELLEVDEVAADESFFDLGGHSLQLAQLHARLRDEVIADRVMADRVMADRVMAGEDGDELAVIDLFTHTTVRAMARHIASLRRGSDGLELDLRDEQAQGRAPRPVVDERRAAARVRDLPENVVAIQRGATCPLFLAHPVGGQVFLYANLIKALGAHWTVFGLRAQGIREGESPLREIEAMATRYVEQIRAVQPRGPYRIGGSSMGGTVAFEMARQLEAAGESVELLVLIDAVGSDQMARQPEDDADYFEMLLGHVVSLPMDALRSMSEADQIEAILEIGKESGAFSPSLTIDGARRLLRTCKANAEALFDYEYKPYPAPMLYLRAAEHREDASPHPELPWIDLAAGGIEIHTVPGDHRGLHSATHADAVVAPLRRALERLETDP